MCLLRCWEQCNFYRNYHSLSFFPNLLHCKYLRTILAAQELDSLHQVAAAPPGPSSLWPQWHTGFMHKGRIDLCCCALISVSPGCWKPLRPRVSCIYQWWQWPVLLVVTPRTVPAAAAVVESRWREGEFGLTLSGKHQGGLPVRSNCITSHSLS